ncbi:MAG: hypothetical protein ACOC8E_05960, partial [Planctomycetota bacterium]
DLSRSAAPDLKLASLVSRDAVRDRMAKMGEGIKLVEHKSVTYDDGSRESQAVFKIPDVNEFVYVSPLVREGGYAYRTRAKARIFCITRGGHRGRQRAGNIGFRLEHMSNGRQPPKEKRTRDEPPPPGPSPEELQVLRELQPVFRDLMKGLKVRFTFESYAPIHTVIGWRGRQERARSFDLIHFDADAAMDAHDYPFLENEEIMLDFLRGQLDSDRIRDHLEGWASNHQLPVLHRRVTVMFPPSRRLFDRYVKGKTLHCPYRRLSPETDYNTTVTFDQVGWKGD